MRDIKFEVVSESWELYWHERLDFLDKKRKNRAITESKDSYGMWIMSHRYWCYRLQYTWFKDKNWLEIYELDTLQYKKYNEEWSKKTERVYFDESVGSWYCWGNLLSSLLHEQNNDERKISQNFKVTDDQYAIVVWGLKKTFIA